MAIYPDFFDPSRVDKDLFMWAYAFLYTRVFGWGLPSTMAVPLADCLNHSPQSMVSLDIFEKNLHASMNKIYLYQHNFEEDVGNDDPDKVYVKTESKLKVNCSKLFSEDEIQQLPIELLEKWDDQHDEDEQDAKKIYSRDLCFQRFEFNRKRLTTDEEIKFEEDDQEFGQQLWGIGYKTSDCEEDNDD